MLDTENVSYANNTILGNSIKKSESDIANTVKKPIILWEQLKIIKKTPNDLENFHPDFSEEGKEERPAEHVDDFRIRGNASFNSLSQIIIKK